jgi:hypothetical protein
VGQAVGLEVGLTKADGGQYHLVAMEEGKGRGKEGI